VLGVRVLLLTLETQVEVLLVTGRRYFNQLEGLAVAPTSTIPIMRYIPRWLTMEKMVLLVVEEALLPQ